MFNRAAQHLFGCRSASVAGRALGQFVPEWVFAEAAGDKEAGARTAGGRFWLDKGDGRGVYIEASVSRVRRYRAG